MLVSIIIPCYNVEAYVSDALESALAQTYRPLEIIAVDNNSTDGTKDILLEYQRRFGQLITVLEEKKQGAPAARNLGLRHAKGEWIQFLDADDVILPEKISIQVNLIQEKKEGAAVVFGAYRFLLQDGTSQEIPVKYDCPWLSLVSSYAGITSSNLWKKAEVEAAGGWLEGQYSSQEYILLFEILKRSSLIIKDDSINTEVRKRPGSISTAEPAESLKVAGCLHLDLFEYVKQNRKEIYARHERQFLGVLLKLIVVIGNFDFFHALEKYRKHFQKKLLLDKDEELILGRFFSFFYKRFPFSAALAINVIYVNFKLSDFFHFLRRWRKKFNPTQ